MPLNAFSTLQQHRWSPCLLGLSLALGAIGLACREEPQHRLSRLLSDEEAQHAGDALCIYGGEADPNFSKREAVAQLLYTNNRACSGVAVASSWVLTAAHCVPANGLPSKAAFPNGSKIPRDGRICVHPSFSTTGGNLRYDLALVPLKSAAPDWEGRWQDVEALTPTPRMVVWGWRVQDASGVVFLLPGAPYRTDPFDLLDRGACQTEHGGPNTPPDVDAEEFCAGSSGGSSCVGDSGGPLFAVDNNDSSLALGLLGVVSSGKAGTCSNPWDIYTKAVVDLPATPINDWVKEVISNGARFPGDDDDLPITCGVPAEIPPGL